MCVSKGFFSLCTISVPFSPSWRCFWQFSYLKNSVGLLWQLLWNLQGEFTPLDKSNTHKFLQDKFFSGDHSDSILELLRSLISDQKVLHIIALAFSEVLTEGFTAPLSALSYNVLSWQCPVFGLCKKLSLNFNITCLLERLGIFHPTVPGSFLFKSFSFTLFLSSCVFTLSTKNPGRSFNSENL